MYWVSFIKTCHDPAEKLTPMIQLVATHIDLFKDIQNGKSNSVSLQCAEIYKYKLSLLVNNKNAKILSHADSNFDTFATFRKKSTGVMIKEIET